MPKVEFDYGNNLKMYKFATQKEFYKWIIESGQYKQYNFILKLDENRSSSYYCLVDQEINICCTIEQKNTDNDDIRITYIYNTGIGSGYIRSCYLDIVRDFITDYLNYDIDNLSDQELEQIGYVKNHLDDEFVDIFDIQNDLNVSVFFIDWLENPKVDSTKIKRIAFLRGDCGDENKFTNTGHINIYALDLSRLDLTNFVYFNHDFFPELHEIYFYRCKTGRSLSLSTCNKIARISFQESDLTNMKNLDLPKSVRKLDLSGAKLGYFKLGLERTDPFNHKFVFEEPIPIY